MKQTYYTYYFITYNEKRASTERTISNLLFDTFVRNLLAIKSTCSSRNAERPEKKEDVKETTKISPKKVKVLLVGIRSPINSIVFHGQFSMKVARHMLEMK